jgi:hypothetical protein
VLVHLAKEGTDEHKEKAAGALWNLAHNTPSNREAIRDSGGIPVLVRLAKEGTVEQKTHATGALNSLASKASREAICDSGGIPVLVELAKNGTGKQKECAAGALCAMGIDATYPQAILKVEAIEKTATNVAAKETAEAEQLQAAEQVRRYITAHTYTHCMRTCAQKLCLCLQAGTIKSTLHDMFPFDPLWLITDALEQAGGDVVRAANALLEAKVNALLNLANDYPGGFSSHAPQSTH